VYPKILDRFVIGSAALSLLSLLIGCGASTPSVSGPIPSASTTLQAETGNNTSAVNSFPGQTNGNAAAANVSKLPIPSLLYSGATTKVYGHLLGWFGKPNHISVGYQSNTSAQVHAQVQDMMSRGMAGAVLDWYGPSDPFIDGTAMLLKNEAEAQSGKFEFAIVEDKGALGAAAAANGCDVTNQFISDLSYIAANYESSPAYMKVNGRPVVFLFDVDQFYIDWTRARASIPGNPLLIARGTNGLTSASDDGGFSWVRISNPTPFDPELNQQDTFFQTAQSNSQKFAVGAVFKGFNDTLASWGTNRVIDQDCGQTWLQSFSEIGKFYNSGNQLPALQTVTWNDYEEGTAIEDGIDNCVFLVPSQSGSTISWAVNGQENTIDHYTVFISSDGKNLSSLIDIPSGTHSVDLSKLQVSSGKTYFVFIQAVGLPTIQNKMSPAIAYHPGDQPPDVTLNVSQTGTKTFSASATASSGTAAKTVIDFGDGTVVDGGSGSHTYQAVGRYLITATIYDSTGASSVAVQQVSTASTSGGVNIASPSSGATVNWPTSIVATGPSGSNVSAMQVLVDGQVAYAAHGDTINTAVKVFTGKHQVQVQALDSSGNAIGSASLNVTAEPGDIAPTAKIVLTAMPQISSTTFLACTAQSVDPDGFFISRSLKFSDGSHFSGPSALKTFPSPGSYTATATVEDNFGATDSTTVTFTVP
jgi:PKD domain